LTNISDKVINKLKSILLDYGAVRVAIFGSYARGERQPDSDLDVLVKFVETKSLLELVKIERELQEKIGIKVDLVTEGSVSPYIIGTIKEEEKVIVNE